MISTSVLLAAAFAGLVAIGATVAVERLGGRLGGVLASIPTTIVPASLGMYATAASPEAFTSAMTAVPAGMLVDAAFLWTWRALPRRLPAWSLPGRLATMVVVSLSIWALGAWAFVQAMDSAGARGADPIGPGVLAFVALIGLGIASCLGAPPAPRGANPVPWPMLLARGALAALAIGVSVALAESGSPVLGGMASVFPAIFLTTMVSLWLAQGEAVPIGAVGPIILGSASVAAFALLATALLPALGPVFGTLATWWAAVGVISLPAAWWLTRSPAHAAS